MKKSKKVRVVSYTLAAALSLSAASVLLSACGNQSRDNESTPLTLASDMFDSVFNPFFYTSGPDGEVVAQTQIGMLSSDENGQPVAGEDEPCVAQAYSIVTTGSRDDMANDDDYSHYYTDYYFAIKEGLTFSDGEPLTINDVLFNIYMYLDPAYAGSVTMYSVDIQGLDAYRTQTADESQQDQFEQMFDNMAQGRIDSIRDWAENDREGDADALTDEQKSDIDKLEELYMEELNSDWTAAMNVDLKEYEKYGFTKNYEVFLYNHGQITATKKPGTENEYDIDRLYDENMATDQTTMVNYVFNVQLGGRDRASAEYKQNLVDVLLYSATASSLRSYLVSEAMRDYFDQDGDGEVDLTIRTISGITTEKMTSLPSENGNIDLGGERDVLHIRINGEDPKAIQNFSFTVAPMHYYSPIADQFTLEEGKENFGVSWADSDFMDQIRVIQVPLGAGPYRATTRNGSSATQTIDKGAFYENNVVYLERNDSFLLGAPKIKYVRYQVVSQSSLYNAIKTGAIDYGSPTATNTMMGNLEGADKDTVDYTITENLGYGYIGINAAYVKDIEIRKAIMSAINPQLALDYYNSSDLASIIYRPMSKTLVDYYPTEATSYYPYDSTGKTALAYAQMAGYEIGSDSKLVNSAGERLKFTFTIAGDTQDHPAWNALSTAARILNDIGFDITVTTDSTALVKLATGRLEVWAAAWSSSSDPDMYQVYHKDSTATSILNWGFPTLEREGTTFERDLLDALAAKIEEGRETTVVAERRNAYSVSTSAPLYTVTTTGEGDNMEVTIEENPSADMNNLCALDLVMELAVEYPLYQRSALFVYQRGIFDEATLDLFGESTAFQSPLSKIWLLSYAQ